MTWEETIISIRRQPEFADLVEKAYFDENLVLNIERFNSSLEFTETKKIMSRFFPSLNGLQVLDIGSGNGISAVSFALEGSNVTAVEPDTSHTVGSGAIRKLKEHYRLSNLYVVDAFGEKLPFNDISFDMVYIRQAMHHAKDLKVFIGEATRVLKRGGVLFTVRDHVIFDIIDKQWFLDSHPLQKYYGGENAFSVNEYKEAMVSAGLKIEKVLKYFDSVINYFPVDEKEIQQLKISREKLINNSLSRKLPSFLSRNSLIRKYYSIYVDSKLGPPLDERVTPGRMYSFIAVKPV